MIALIDIWMAFELLEFRIKNVISVDIFWQSVTRVLMYVNHSLLFENEYVYELMASLLTNTKSHITP